MKKCAIENGSNENITPLLYSFREFILSYESRALQYGQGTFFDADDFKLFLLGTIRSTFEIDYRSGQQHDAHEILSLIFQLIRPELETVGVDPTEFYNFSYTQVSTCTSCGLENSQPGVFQFGLTLSVAPNASDIIACLNDYLRNEHVELICSGAQCNSRSVIVSKTDIVFPDLLIILFNRYQGLSLHNSPVSVPLHLQLNASEYVLRGVVNHFGIMEQGHYQSVVIVKGKQFKISDERVEHNENEAIDRCYLAFYERLCFDDNAIVVEHALPSLLASPPEDPLSASFLQDKSHGGKKTQGGSRSRPSRQGKQAHSLPVIEQEETNEVVKERGKKANAAKRSREYRKRNKDKPVMITQNEVDLSSVFFMPPRKKIKVETSKKQYILCEAAPRPSSTSTGNLCFLYNVFMFIFIQVLLNLFQKRSQSLQKLNT